MPGSAAPPSGTTVRCAPAGSEPTVRTAHRPLPSRLPNRPPAPNPCQGSVSRETGEDSVALYLGGMNGLTSV